MCSSLCIDTAEAINPYISIATTPGQVITICGGAATEEFTVRSLKTLLIRQRYGARLSQLALQFMRGSRGGTGGPPPPPEICQR